MTTRTAKIRTMSIAQIKATRQALGLNVTLLLDNGFIVRTQLSTLYNWGDLTKIGATIVYDVDEQGRLSNPRPAPLPCPCGDEPASCQKAHCLIDTP